MAGSLPHANSTGHRPPGGPWLLLAILVVLLHMRQIVSRQLQEVPLPSGSPGGHAQRFTAPEDTRSSSSTPTSQHRVLRSAATPGKALLAELPKPASAAADTSSGAAAAAATAAAAAATAAAADNPGSSSNGSSGVLGLPASSIQGAATRCAPVQRLSRGVAAVPPGSLSWPGCYAPGNMLIWVPQRCGSSLQGLQYIAVYAVSNQTKALASSASGGPCLITRTTSNLELTSQLLSSGCESAPIAARGLPTVLCAPVPPDLCFSSNANQVTDSTTATMRLSAPVKCPTTGEPIRLLNYTGKPCGPDKRFTQWVEATSKSGCKLTPLSLATVATYNGTQQELAKLVSDVFGSCGLNPALASAPKDIKCVVQALPSAGASDPVLPKMNVKAGETLGAQLQRIGVGMDGLVPDLSHVPAEQQVTVAVVDSGIDRSHPDLNMVGGKSFVNASAEFPDDDDPGVDHYGHGTLVSGIIGARNDGARCIGVSPGIQLFSLKVVAGNGQGIWRFTQKAIEWAISEGRQQHGIRIINLSMDMSRLDVGPNDGGFNEAYSSVCGLMKRADEAGVLVVVSAGNQGISIRTSFPAVCRNAATVTGLNAHVSAPLNLSNYLEADADEADKAHIFASPGADVPSTLPMAEGVNSDSGVAGVYFISGTSAAAPFVAGVAANCLMSGACPPGSSGSDILQKLQAAARERAASHPESRFQGDPLTPNSDFAGRYYGHLVWSKW